jgi:hypothetical protein
MVLSLALLALATLGKDTNRSHTICVARLKVVKVSWVIKKTTSGVNAIKTGVMVLSPALLALATLGKDTNRSHTICVARLKVTKASGAR